MPAPSNTALTKSVATSDVSNVGWRAHSRSGGIAAEPATGEVLGGGISHLLKWQLERISFEDPTLAPLGHTFFCIHYPSKCAVHRMVFRGGRVKLTANRWKDLSEVNNSVNRSIIAERKTEGLVGERWTIGPARGDCKDFAVTKQQALVVRGWPRRALLLAEVVTRWGEHHLVLVARTSEGDFVLDNMAHAIRFWSRSPYTWVRIQTPSNPRLWSTVGREPLVNTRHVGTS